MTTDEKIFTSEKRPTEWSTKIIIIGEKHPYRSRKDSPCTTELTRTRLQALPHIRKKIFFNENILHKNPITPPTHDERDV